ncbi:histone-fold-containing protein [Pyronema omphalodes]|nr:histone-fold-containing protein [Pyronema omphalodes]
MGGKSNLSGRRGPRGAGLGKSIPGRGIGAGLLRRHRRKIAKDSIMGITKPDLRRLARRGGVKRMSISVYPEMRLAMKSYMTTILRDCVVFLEHANRKTVTVYDVAYALKRMGRTLYGFDHPDKPEKRGPKVPIIAAAGKAIKLSL